MKRIIILGSTGSIGRQALEIVQRTGEYQVVGLGARRDVDTLREQTPQFHPQVVAMTDAAAARRLRADISPQVEVLSGPEAMRELAVNTRCNRCCHAVRDRKPLSEWHNAGRPGYRLPHGHPWSPAAFVPGASVAP